jgi:hypothetical protein
MEDNQGCIKLAENPVVHGRSKHIDVRYHFIRERVGCCSTNDMVADILTKPLDREKFVSSERRLELRRHIMMGHDSDGDRSLFTIVFR